MLILVAPLPDGSARVRDLDADGQPGGPAQLCPDPAALAARIGPRRVVWAGCAQAYPRLLRAGLRVQRCHDIELTEALLLGYEGRWGEPRSLAAAWARLRGLPVPPDPTPAAPVPPGERQEALFDTGSGAAELADPLAALAEVWRDQQRRIGATAAPGRFRLLVAAESASGLIAAEMGQVGLPWRADVHDALLRDLLGEPSTVGGPPRRLVELTEQIAGALGGQRIHPDSPAEVVRALGRVGVSVPNTRAWVLRQVEHPAAALLLEYKELYRIWVAHGWSWRAQWVRDGRFHAEYVPGGVVSGRWATRGGGALQIPRAVRRAVCADPGWKLVVADAGQLEPRILAAVSGDARMSRAAGAGDMYDALAAESFGGDRAKAKVALLGAMYGQTGGAAAPALATLRQSYPTALSYVESAARIGEGGGLVRSWLGRTCPPQRCILRRLRRAGRAAPGRRVGAGAGPVHPQLRHPGHRRRVGNSLLALLRPALPEGAELVFFQHDEVIVHCPAAQGAQVAQLVTDCAEQARRLLFGDSPVRLPVQAHVVDSYAEAK